MFKESTLDIISKDPNLAKQVLRGLETEVIRLQAALAKAVNYDGKVGLLQEVEEWLVESQLNNALLKKKLFGRSTEKRDLADQDMPSDDAASSDTQKKRVKPEQSGRGQVGVDLALFPEEHSLKEGAKCDCALASPLKKVKQAEITFVVDYVAAKLIRKKIIRWKYRAKSCGCVTTAPGPTTLVNGGQYGIDLAVEVVARKFQDHLPWERQVKAFKRDGLEISATTLWNQTRHVANLLDGEGGVYDQIRKGIEAAQCRHADETRWRIIEGVSQTKQYAWLFRDGRHAYFTIEDSRGGNIPLKVMPKASGALVADDYAGYNALVSENGLTRVQCWSHTRRKFHEIREHYPAIEVYLDLVGELYQLDSVFKSEGSPSAQRRKELCGPVIEAIDVWRKHQKTLPKSSFGRALKYMDDNWVGLTVFLKDPSLPLDNNPAENALRQLVLGRKNFMHNRSKDGARVCSILYTIAVSCAMNNVDIKEYLKETILRIRNCRGFQLPYDFANQRETVNLI